MILRISYAWMIVMLLVSTVALGDILSIGPGAYSDAEVSALGSTDFDQEHTSGWIYKYTDETAICSWSYDYTAETEARVLLFENEWASVLAAAEAKISGAATAEGFVSASVSGTGEYDAQYLEDVPDPNDDFAAGYSPLDPYEGIGGDTQTLAVANIEEGSDCMAYAWAKAEAIVTLID